ncbi:uncharacterized protein Desi [Hetaerina americana]|uniref:uncharacterized protein Desi n=1 Tax=Hetaerina americana TaxID=62018 RepID=UPI003A7F5D8B
MNTSDPHRGTDRFQGERTCGAGRGTLEKWLRAVELGITLTAPFLNIPLTTGAHQYEGTIGHLVPGAYAPLNYDLGGLVLAGALAIGSALLLPKVIPFANNPEEIFNHGGYPNHGRVDDLNKLKNANETENKFPSLWSRLDENLLSNYNIDMTSCAQRIICSAVHAARDGVSNGKPTVMDSFIHMLTEMPVLRSYVPSSWRDIADVAWSADNISKQNIACDDANMHKRCPVNPEMAKMLFRTLAPNIGIV